MNKNLKFRITNNFNVNVLSENDCIFKKLDAKYIIIFKTVKIKMAFL